MFDGPASKQMPDSGYSRSSTSYTAIKSEFIDNPTVPPGAAEETVRVAQRARMGRSRTLTLLLVLAVLVVVLVAEMFAVCGLVQ